MATEIQAPRVSSLETPRQILKEDFRSIPELPISGGWGYSLEDAVVIEKDDPTVPREVPFDGVGLEYIFVEKRIYEELIIFCPENGRYSGIEWKCVEQRCVSIGERQYDILKVRVTALPDQAWEELKAEWEGPDGYASGRLDAEKHLRKREALTVSYMTEYWFDITSFFGRTS